MIQLTNRFDEAFQYAHHLHRGQLRKGTRIPYISHLMMSLHSWWNTAAMKTKRAGLLHHAAEDQLQTT